MLCVVVCGRAGVIVGGACRFVCDCGCVMLRAGVC